MSNCHDCKKKGCSGGCSSTQGGSSAQSLQNYLIKLQVDMATILNNTKWLAGHPIVALDEQSDIDSFDATTGKGFGIWIGWGVCNGNSYTSPTGNIATENLSDRFLTGAGGTYAVGDTGGENFHTLITAELPVHNHALTDPGHLHTITDPGHVHTIADPGHIHSGTAEIHQHTFTTSVVADHQHGLDGQIPNINTVVDASGTGATGGEATLTYGGGTTTPGGAHSHTGTTDPATPVVDIASAVTGISINSNTTGITVVTNVTGVTIADTGSGTEHENRPPYYAVLWVKKIY